jgi:hypothetical protein
VQAIVGGLVAKTLSSASSGAYYAAQRVAAAPPVAFDVFSVQVSSVWAPTVTLCLLARCFPCLVALWRNTGVLDEGGQPLTGGTYAAAPLLHVLPGPQAA